MQNEHNREQKANQDRYKRYSGVCKRFGYAKRYGFITSTDINGEIFVHENEIKSKSVRCLNVGERVEFNLIVLKDGRKKALKVTGPNSAFVQGEYSFPTLCHEIHCLSSSLQTLQSEKNRFQNKNRSLTDKLGKLQSERNESLLKQSEKIKKLKSENNLLLSFKLQSTINDNTGTNAIMDKYKRTLSDLNQLKYKLQMSETEKKSLETYVNQRNKNQEIERNKLCAGIRQIEQDRDRQLYKQTILRQERDRLKETNEIQQKNIEKLLDERKEMEYKYNKLLEQNKKFGFKLWNANDITNWIISIDTMRFNKYYNVLLQNMTNECIDGTCLADLTRDELKGLGITHFKDRVIIFDAIQQLVNPNKNKKEIVQNIINNAENDVEGVCTHYM
eukprot:441815_1